MTMETCRAIEVPEFYIKPHQMRQAPETENSSVEKYARPLPCGDDIRALGPTQEYLEEKGVCELLRTFGVTEVPDYYVKPPHLRMSNVKADPTMDVGHHPIPVVDLGSSREDVMRTIAEACQWGFFQIINHGTPLHLLNKIASDAKEFFALPVQEKIRCSTPAKVVGPVHFGGGSKGDWRDVLKIQCAPPSAIAREHWPRQPTSFRDTLTLYYTEQQALALKLLEMISESLGLEKGYIKKEIGDPRILVAFNHYPPCPDPSLTIGIREHSDPNTITVLLQDQVAGLQVCQKGRWIDVEPLKDALVVNVGDHLQILSNGRYQSCLHRVVNNKSKSRTSIAMFLSPSLSSRVRPAPCLVDDEHPAVFRDFVYADFLKDFYRGGGPNNKVILSQFQNHCT